LRIQSQSALEPRKTPVQARSGVSVEAILNATIQVLIKVGKGRLTTTRVAARAGVSVGTLYQYFPNKCEESPYRRCPLFAANDGRTGNISFLT
jgi:hypothetical protein